MPALSGIPIKPVSGSGGFPLAQLLPLAGQGKESEDASIRGKSRGALGHATTRWHAVNTAGQ